MELNDLEIYKISKQISKDVWEIYKNLSWQDKKIFGDQFISSVDSVGANIAEGFGRYHFADKNKFNYNARGSLLESIHWLELMKERGKINNDGFNAINKEIRELHKKLNSYINSTKIQIKNNKD